MKATQLKKGLAISFGVACVIALLWVKDIASPPAVTKTAWFVKYRRIVTTDSSTQNPLFPGGRAIFTGVSMDDLLLPSQKRVAVALRLTNVTSIVSQSVKPDRSVEVLCLNTDFTDNRLPKRNEIWAVCATRAKGERWLLVSAYSLASDEDMESFCEEADVTATNGLSPNVAKLLQTRAAKDLRLPVYLALPLRDGIVLRGALIPSGSFAMGANVEDRGFDDECPVHAVTITNPYYVGQYEITQEQYALVTGKNPSRFRESHNPVDSVSWNEAMQFCEIASRLSGRRIRLPTEAEWEYACRAGSRTMFSWGRQDRDEAGRLVLAAGQEAPSPVGSYAANPWGLYDMHGNVSEWCSDWYWQDYYCYSPRNNPIGPRNGRFHSLRGGDWSTGSRLCGASVRIFPVMLDYMSESIGFRVVIEIPRSAESEDM